MKIGTRVGKCEGKCVCVCVCVRERERERERERDCTLTTSLAGLALRRSQGVF